ncbi:hypothetical protein ACIP5Y_04320 [Nocardia sp. NPDC088792]|uniref:hypothetical protein n=1 Tax=Nocardia sp. NPDC088792 TaxID=3364332 RepID=UPI0038286DAF
MSTDPKESANPRQQSQTFWWTIGFILLIQGFGSGITDLIWHHPFGVSSLVIYLGAPNWVSWLFGLAGAAAVTLAMRREAAERDPK